MVLSSIVIVQAWEESSSLPQLLSKEANGVASLGKRPLLQLVDASGNSPRRRNVLFGHLNGNNVTPQQQLRAIGGKQQILESSSDIRNAPKCAELTKPATPAPPPTGQPLMLDTDKRKHRVFDVVFPAHTTD